MISRGRIQPSLTRRPHRGRLAGHGMRTGLLVLIAGAFAIAQPSTSAPVTLQSSVDRSQMVIGDALAYELRVEWPEGFETPLVHPGMRLGEFEIVDVATGEVTAAGRGRKSQTHTYTLSTFDTGDFEIPPFSVRYSSADGATTGVVQTAPIQITVTGVKDAEAATDIRDLKPPVAIPPDLTRRNLLIAAAVGGLIALVLLLMYLRRRARLRRLGRVEPVAPPRPPDEEAFEALDALGQNLPSTREEAMAFYVRLSEILRVFLGRRHGFDGLDRTTSEIMDALRHSELSRPDREAIEDFLCGCDLVKFARFPADPDQAAAAIETARGIIRPSAAVAAPAPAAAPARQEPAAA